MAISLLNARLPQMLASQRNHAWEPIYTTPVAGKTVVVIGFGDLGQGGRPRREEARRQSHCRHPQRQGRRARPTRHTRVSRIDRVLPKADFVIVTTPLTPETREPARPRAPRSPQAGRRASSTSAARPIVDYDALREKLAQGELAGAVLDVFQPEPLPADSPLWDTPNLIALPHVTCDDPRYIAAAVRFLVRELRSAFSPASR